MIVDDYDIFRKQFRRQLDACGDYTIHVSGEADNGVSALKLMQESEPDILFTDIRMPKMDGIMLLEQIRKRNLCRFVVLVSEYTDFEYARKGLVLGAFDYLVKPVRASDVEKLLGRICDCLEDEKTQTADTYGEKEIEECILSRGPYLEGLAGDFTEHYRKRTGTDAVRCALGLAEALERIMSAVLREHCWLKNFLMPVSHFREELVRQETPEQAAARTKEYLLTVDGALRRYYPKNISAITEKAVQYVLQHPTEKVTLSDIAEVCNVNYAYISRCFKTDMKVSFVDYCTDYRMAMARLLLCTTDLSIMSIADRLQYDDYKYMSRIFKSTTGMTPSEYRRSHEA